MREWIVGRQPVYETLRAARRQGFTLHIARGIQPKGRIADCLRLAQQRRLPVREVPREQLDKLTPIAHQGIALQASRYPYVALADILHRADQSDEPPFFLILDAVQDPQNLGTLLRTADAVGVHGVLLPPRRTATVTPAVVTASSGASEHLWITQTNLAQAIAVLKREDIWVVGLDGSPQASPLSQVNLRGPLALVVGNEGRGMRPLVRKACDTLLRLPMRGHVESLNAATAGSVALYFAWQARQFSQTYP
ncbi:MAG: 23S rRNA (guanosine(2251)-2'-O)-methyltransferase RlmB [Anaerolineae bacterium]|nr:MAG: 23S rRNA (guanosine(2251)-2'-O)-methyltransferase RlmB [Anaerolineae bacterium]